MSYTDIHRTFLQAIATHGALSHSKAIKLLTAINAKYEEATPSEENLKTLIREINSKIKPFDQEIRYVQHDLVKDEEFVVFVNNVEAEIHMSQSFYTESDRHFFSLMLGEIISNEMNIQRIVALNLISRVKPKTLNKNQAEMLIDSWIATGYFLEQDDLIYFGPKILAEFSDYLLKIYPDFVKKCFLCMTTALMGVACDDCEEMYHKNCVKMALTKNRNCPSCKASWSKDV